MITAVLAAGALDAWLTPILMKKGRPAHTFRALVAPDRAAEVRATVFRETTTIGIREYPVARHALPRETTTVTVGGLEIAVKLARLDGVVVTAQPEYDDVVRAAQALGRPVREVLAEAVRRRPGAAGRLMDLTALALTFGAIFVVELPDKTFLATLVLATKYRPILVWLGVGRGVRRADHGRGAARPRGVVPARGRRALGRAGDVPRRGGDPDPRGAQPPAGLRRGVRRGRPDVTGFRAVLASFLVLFAAEWGDLSQLLTISLVARYEAPVSVFVGALGALLLVSGLAVLAGRTLLRFVVAARAALRRRRRLPAAGGAHAGRAGR